MMHQRNLAPKGGGGGTKRDVGAFIREKVTPPIPLPSTYGWAHFRAGVLFGAEPKVSFSPSVMEQIHYAWGYSAPPLRKDTSLAFQITQQFTALETSLVMYIESWSTKSPAECYTKGSKRNPSSAFKRSLRSPGPLSKTQLVSSSR